METSFSVGKKRGNCCLIIEQITGKPYHDILHEYIFQRLHMEHSYLSQFSEPQIKSSLPVAHVNALGKEINVERHRSFTSIYSSGQTVSTSEDLLTFMKALTGNKLISQKALTEMMHWQKMQMGIDYGYGLMRVRMFAFLSKYNAWGHLGSTGSFMLYNPALDVYLLGSFNKTGYTGQSIRFLFNVLRTLVKYK